VLRRGVACAAVALALVLGSGGGAAGAGVPVDPPAQASATCGHGSPHSTPGGVKCLAPGEYCSHKAGYAAAYHRAGFRCNSSGRLEYD
jgi:hypothetical protein